MWISKKKYAQMCLLNAEMLQLKAEMQEEISDLRLSLMSARSALVEAKKWMRRRDPKTGHFVKTKQACGE